MTIKNIVLSGGAYKGFYTIGALKYLSENNFYNINDIEKMYGTSVGSLLGALLCLKLNWKTPFLELQLALHPFLFTQ